MTDRRNRILLLIIIALCVYSMVPFLLISKYNHPQSDDYHNVIRNRQSHFLDTQISYYTKWSGRYSNTAFSWLNPLQKENLAVYRLLSPLLIALVIVSISLLVIQLCGRFFSKLHVLALACFFILLYFIRMPSASEGIYWFSGYIPFQVPTILTLLFLSAIYRIGENKNARVRILLKALSVVLLIVIIGFNTLSMIIINAIVLLLNLYAMSGSKKPHPFYALLFLVSLAFSLVLLLAPGNYHRLELFLYSRNIALSLMAAPALMFYSLVKWGLPVAVFSLIYMLLWGDTMALKMRQKNEFREIKFRHSFPVYLFILFLLFFTYTWLTGSRPAGRADNVIYVFFVAGWFFNLNILLMNREGFPETGITKTGIVPVSIVAAIFVLTIFSLDNTVSTAYIDLISGKAKKYDHELTQRYELIRSCEADTCMVPALKNIPATLFFRDIASPDQNADTYINKRYAAFFGKNYIWREPGPVTVKSNAETLEEFLKDKRLHVIDGLRP